MIPPKKYGAILYEVGTIRKERMRYKKPVNKRLNRYQKRTEQQKRLADSLKGDGSYLFQNNTGGDLILPKKTKDGIKLLNKNAQFEGDSYFFQLVRQGQLRYIKELNAPEERTEDVTQTKLILDQPDRVTAKGTVEQVIADQKQKPLNEVAPTAKKQSPPADVLINEDPMDGVEILLN
jgi:hypothetical protein